MSVETQNPEVETPDVETNNDAFVDDSGNQLQVELLPGKFFKLKKRERKVKGEDKYQLLISLDIKPEEVLEVLTAKLNQPEGTRLLETILIKDIIIPASNDATGEAFVTDAAGDESFDEDKFVETFWASILPGDRKRGGGVTIKDLRARLQEASTKLALAVNELRSYNQKFEAAAEEATKQGRVAPHRSEFVPEDVENRCHQLVLEVSQTSAKIEEKSRVSTGRPKGSKNKKG